MKSAFWRDNGRYQSNLMRTFRVEVSGRPARIPWNKMNQTGQAWRSLLLGALLIGATVATYWPVLENDFINYDDPDYVTANEVVKRGLTWNGVQWAFATGHASNWHPVTWLSHMLDVSWFGLRPAGHHATNLFLHVANTLLLWRLLLRMTGSLWRSALVAGLFALHPLHVESVAWVAERKDVLSTFFGLLTLLAYVRFAQCKIQNSKFKIEEEELGRGGQGKGQKAKGKNLGQAWYSCGSGLLRAGADEQADAGDLAVCDVTAGLLAAPED
ncbi:MAG: hypothetical protein V9H26_01270 [Verrucomicrobiota bacterium]